MTDLIYTILLIASIIIAYTAFMGTRIESKECQKCPGKDNGNCIRCSNDIYNRSVFRTFKEVWRTNK